ncbi:MAG: DUF21 domain-containing protein [Candidatus Omnitrophica bacterium]|nr:DUF21 domain-containing protein [Candidatus Omnitrophota bacterium]
MDNLMLITGIMCGLAFAAFFSGTEMAFVSLKKILLRKKPGRDEGDLVRIQQIMRRPARFISLVLIGTNIALVIASSLATILTKHLLPNRSILFIELLVIMILTPVIVFFCEVIPKNVGVLYAEYICKKVNVAILFFLRVFGPLITFFEFTSDGILRMVGGRPRHKKVFITRQELKGIFDESVLKGVISSREKQLIDTIFEFEYKTVKDRVRTLAKVKKVDVSDTLANVKALAADSTRVRFVVEDKQTGTILGFVHVFDILFEEDEGVSVKNFIRTPVFVKETTTLHEAFETLCERREWMLFALGENEEITGILTLKDILNF